MRLAGWLGNSIKYVLEVGPRVVAVELGRLHQTHHHRRALPGELGSGAYSSQVDTDFRLIATGCADLLRSMPTVIASGSEH